jgi:geranylgeranyl diphosphate synthase type II
MLIDELIPRYRKDLDKCLEEIYPKGPQSLTEPIHYVLNGNGKRLRPLLAILTAEACGGSKKNVLSAALAVEVLHNFTLVHDDIMDRDIIRHGQETVHQKWDDGVAILTGDAMLALALELINHSPLARHELMKIFIEGLMAVCEGQALDKEFENQTSVSIEDYIHMIDLKTGYMIGLAAQIGATASGVDDETSKAVRDYGRLLGRAFQIQDDYMEIFSDNNQMGKSLGSDIMLGKKTFLMIQALEKNSQIIKIAMDNIRKDFNKGMIEIREYMRTAGIQENTQKEINNIIELADTKLSPLNINKKKLLYFSELIKRRGD